MERLERSYVAEGQANEEVETASQSGGVLVLLPLNLIGALDQAAEAFDMSRSDIIRRSLIREVTSVLRDEVMRMKARTEEHERPTLWLPRARGECGTSLLLVTPEAS